MESFILIWAINRTVIESGSVGVLCLVDCANLHLIQSGKGKQSFA